MRLQNVFDLAKAVSRLIPACIEVNAILLSATRCQALPFVTNFSSAAFKVVSSEKPLPVLKFVN